MFGVIPIDVYLMVEHKYWDTLIKEKKVCKGQCESGTWKDLKAVVSFQGL